MLSNPHFGEVFCPFFRKFDFFNSTQEEADFLATAPDEVLEAYLTNSSVAHDVLKPLFDRSGAFASLPDDRWRFSIAVAARNDWLRGGLEYDRVISGPSADYRSTVKSAWKLLDTVEPTEEWARVLQQLIARLPYLEVAGDAPVIQDSGEELEERAPLENGLRRFGEREELERPLGLSFFQKILDLWKSEDEDPESQYNYFGNLRFTIASKAACSSAEVQALLRDHPDSHVRRGYYRGFHPWEEATVPAAYERDGGVFLTEAVENSWFYVEENRQIRQQLYELIRAEGAAGAFDGSWLLNRYYAMEQRAECGLSEPTDED